ncbi:MAG: penicillin acylase family protein [Nocardioidaceae bacterium]
MRRPRWIRVLRWGGLALAVVLVATLLSAVWTVQRSMPQTEGSLTLDGIDAEVIVIRDDYGIPQIYADSTDDLFYAQGYVQAQDRFFQIDFRRHVTAGRLTELFGRDALEADTFVRTLGWRRVAQRELPLLRPATRSYLENFAQGVNAYLADRSGAELSLEYAVLGLNRVASSPEPWTSVDSLAWLKAMAWNLGSNMDEEITRSLLSTQLTRREIAILYPPYPYDENQPTVDQGAIVDGVFEQDATRNGTRLPNRAGYLSAGQEALLRARRASDAVSDLLGRGGGLGSNAWAVSGKHTKSGAPLLANDPHLEASMPSVWYQMGLHCNEVSRDCPFDVSGFTFAGFPGVVIGHNARIAWGFTNLYPDVQDLYLEKVSGDSVLYGGRQVALRTREESFDIAGEDEPVTVTVRESRHGPLISEASDTIAHVGEDAPVPGASPSRDEGYAVALEWTALTPGRTADALFAINAASNFDDFRDAARDFQAPSQNLVYADVDGHIGYQAPGTIPVRRTGQGDWPVPGWDPAYGWAPDPIPYEALPTVLDPEDGYVVSANQSVAGRGYPYFLGSSFDYGYRAQRIRGLLEGSDELTPEDMSRIQLDDYSSLARALTPWLRSVRIEDGYYRGGQQVLSSWDFRMDAGSPGAAYFNVVWSRLLDLTFSDQLPPGPGPTATRAGGQWCSRCSTNRTTSSGTTSTPPTLSRSVTTSCSRRCCSPATSSPQSSPATQTTGAGACCTSSRFATRHWGHRAPRWVSSSTVDPMSSGGGTAVPHATSWDASEGYEVTAVPSMRMVVPLDDLDAARWINLTGASGHAYNDNYTDQTELWAVGETLPWAFTRDRVVKAGVDVLVLKPA